MAVSEDKKKTLLWLEYYGLSRAKGKSAAATCVALGKSPDAAVAQLDAELGVIGAVNSLTAAQLDASLQIMVAAVGAIPIIGGLGGAVMEGVRQLANAIVSEGSASCEKGCGWPVSYERRRFVGLNPPPIQTGSFNFKPLAKVFHDGLVVSGVAPSGADSLGRMYGVFTRFPSRVADGRAKSIQYRDWYNSDRIPGGPLPEGRWANPWDDLPNTWMARAWRVEHGLAWAQDKIPCNHLMCCAAQLFAVEQAVWQTVKARKQQEGMGAAEANSVGLSTAGLACRMKGSRWYASIYWLWRDFWDLAQARGIPQTAAMLRSIGESDAATELEEAAGGKPYSKKDMAFPWPWPLVSRLGWDSLRTAVRKLAVEAAFSGLASGTLLSSVQLAPYESCRRSGGVWYQGRCLTQAQYREAQAALQRQQETAQAASTAGKLLLGAGAFGALWWLFKKR